VFHGIDYFSEPPVSNEGDVLRLRFDFQFGFGFRLRLTLFFRGFIPWTPEIGQFQTKVARVGRVGEPGFEVDDAV
jgi:hypothetical protein